MDMRTFTFTLNQIYFFKKIQTDLFQDIKQEVAIGMRKNTQTNKQNTPPSTTKTLLGNYSFQLSYEHVVLVTDSGKMLDHTQMLLSQEQQLPGFY